MGKEEKSVFVAGALSCEIDIRISVLLGMGGCARKHIYTLLS
jgi:hypothetical protein